MTFFTFHFLIKKSTPIISEAVTDKQTDLIIIESNDHWLEISSQKFKTFIFNRGPIVSDGWTVGKLEL